MTKRQAEALIFIKAFIAENRFSPSYDEIAAALGLKAKSNAFRVVCSLQERGFVKTRPGCARSIELTAKAA